MHELGIVFHVIKTVERVGAENDLTRVAGVTLELGEVCGAIQHMDCAHPGELYQHVLQRHHFRINPRRTLFYGLCDRCSGEESS